MTDLRVVRGGRVCLGRGRERLLGVYREVYADVLREPFFSESRYWQRLEGYAERNGFALVVGDVDGELVGYALGCTLPAQARWWNGLVDPVDAGLLAEDGRRTFALNEIMVRAAWRRRGFARALHDALLAGRPEQRATLLVDPANGPARAAYLSWGWYAFGRVKPFPDSATFEALMLDLTRG
ncbi:ribosomal protein S18 acetylase RimI-like enzyme [Hamadaea flava]|uniref:GNAT family N-acetyltransferase n=1 Tax=Hamadaea flava TaxID=1742688 RepID=A0ABV8LLK7_9ACTN|nr:GNAT family N-acetyltransferase [Hamadaea flava]MCP2329622.1 ribosomal protein S18 acetylase RimI-like enzyme [Hamadaea flava]